MRSASASRPMTFSAHHPGAFSYFTPPPLVMSIGGEVLAQWIQQGVDVWHAGPVGAFVEEEVVRWLRDLVGMSGPDAWGVLTSGGVMANLMALAMARDIHLAALLGSDRAPRAGLLEGVRVYASDQTHFSVERGLDVLGFPAGTLRIVALRRPVPAPGRAGGRPRSPRTAPPGSRRSRSAPSRGRRTPVRWTTCPGSPRWRAPRACGSTWTPRTGGPPACRSATRGACPAWSSPTR